MTGGKGNLDWYMDYIYIYNIIIRYMKSVSLKIDERLFTDTEKVLSEMKISRNRYINEAIDYYNRANQRRILETILKQESEIVKKDSMSALGDFEDIDNDQSV